MSSFGDDLVMIEKWRRRSLPADLLVAMNCDWNERGTSECGLNSGAWSEANLLSIFIIYLQLNIRQKRKVII